MGKACISTYREGYIFIPDFNTLTSMSCRVCANNPICSYMTSFTLVGSSLAISPLAILLFSAAVRPNE